MKKIFLITLLLCLTISGQSLAQNHGPDYDIDADIDGSDLGEHAKRIQLGTATLTMDLFALNFGKSFYLAINGFTQYYSYARQLRDGNDIFEEINATALATRDEVKHECEPKYLPGDPPPWNTGCTFFKEVIDENGEIVKIPIGINALRREFNCLDYDEIGIVGSNHTSAVILASGKVVYRTDFSGLGLLTVRLDGTPFDFEQWYGEEVVLNREESWCEQYTRECYESGAAYCTACSWDVWAISSYVDPIVEIITTYSPSSVGSTTLCSGSSVYAYGDSIDLYFPGHDSWWDDAKTVFVTQGTYTGGGFGGFEGADAICNAEAQAAGLLGQFGALLSGISVSGLPTNERYVLPDRTRVMKSLAEADNGTLLAPINMDAYGQAVSGSAWTGTFVGGNRACSGPGCYTCGGSVSSISNDWTRDIGFGMTGITQAVDSNWIESGIHFCGQEAALYCFEK